MDKVDYPVELTPGWWDKKKPLLAKTKKTGIGEALTTLKKAHDSLVWKNFTTDDCVMTTIIDTKLKQWPDLLEPIAAMAKDVQKLAKKKSAEFSSDKKMNKSAASGAASAADSVADVAGDYAAKITEFVKERVETLQKNRKDAVNNIKKILKPMMTKSLDKIKGMIQDMINYAKKPTKENFWDIFGQQDCNARGYTTACKNWDQYLIEFPELRDQCFKGKAMDKFFPGMKDYGAGWSEADFEKKCHPKTGKTGDEAYAEHAKIMLKEKDNIREFAMAIQKLLKLIEKEI